MQLCCNLLGLTQQSLTLHSRKTSHTSARTTYGPYYFVPAGLDPRTQLRIALVVEHAAVGRNNSPHQARPHRIAAGRVLALYGLVVVTRENSVTPSRNTLFLPHKPDKFVERLEPSKVGTRAGGGLEVMHGVPFLGLVHTVLLRCATRHFLVDYDYNIIYIILCQFFIIISFKQ